MVNDLLYISKELLNTISIYDFNDDEKDYIISVVEKTIGAIILELESPKNINWRNILTLILFLIIGIGIGMTIMYLTVLYLLKR